MRIVIEEHKYPAALVKPVLQDIADLTDVNGNISVNYVGYVYNPKINDNIFILPKVLIDEQEKVFGKYAPEEIVDLEAAKDKLTNDEYNFIYELSVWVYRAIVVFNESNSDNGIVRQQFVTQMGHGRIRQSNTFLDIILALLKFNRENQNYFLFILKNLHSGYNKINWTRTIAHSPAIVQDSSPVYLNPVNKKRQINFDEELFIIYFSILNHLQEKYGFPVSINVNFPLIKGEQFQAYLDGLGEVRLHQIKYKYFADKALYLWELCYAFFEKSRTVTVETEDKEYLLVKNFNIVFEAIIDELVGDRRSEIPGGLKDQEDGKRVDHMYRYRDLTNNQDPDRTIYYIGDSKYYKQGTPITDESVYKQFTYARNVIQWNLDLFNDGKPEQQRGHRKLRDEITEGYNVIPNFFISAQQRTLDSTDNIEPTGKECKFFRSRQFDNRLFDRDTFLIAHYDVNFLFIIGLYGRNNPGERKAWKEKVRNMFRNAIQVMLKEKFDFYAMTAKEGVSAVGYIEEHFQQLLGKVFTPYDDRDGQKYYSLALDNRPQFADDNAALVAQLKGAFYIEPCKLGESPYELLKKVDPLANVMAVGQNFLTTHHLERYLNKTIVVGCYHDQAHLDWILGKNDKGTLIYNIRLGDDRPGGQKKSYLDDLAVSFVVLYEYGHEHENRYRVFHVHHHACMTADRMKKAKYPSEPKSSRYFCYVFDEEVTLGNLNIHELLSFHRINNREYEDGAPVFMTGEQMLRFRK